MVMVKEKTNNMIEEEQIDLIAFVKVILSGKKIIIKTAIVFLLLALFIAIFSEKEFTSSTTFIPQVSDSKVGGGLGGLAAMAGINIGGLSSGSEIPTTLYPEIVYSIPFQLELLKTQLTIEDKTKNISYENYYTNVYKPSLLAYIKRYTIGLPSYLISLILNKPKINYESKMGLEDDNIEILYVSQNQQDLIDVLSSQLILEVNEDEGYVTIIGSMPEAIPSAQLVHRAEELLQEFIIDFKIRKSKEKLKFIKERYLYVEEKFIDVQLKLAKFQDKHKFVNTAMSKIELQTLEDEYNLIYGVYNELAKQLEAQYLQVSEDTPVFTILKPVSVPIEKSKPKIGMIITLGLVLGVSFGIGIIYLRVIIKFIQDKWNEHDAIV
tara:strand:- start:16472 stop:17611 length:1140 start_codon:yes stop_codon:yes gene_type:complete